MVLDMSWFGAMSGPPPHPRLSRVPRWCAPHPWDAFVAGACAYFCFGGPVVLFLLGLAPFLFLPMLLFLPLLLGAYWLLEFAWFVHRWYLRYRHEPWTDPPAYPDRRKHLERFLRLKDDCVPCFRDYLSRWFRGADARLIRRENVREFVRYGFYGGVDGPMSAPEEEEIEWFVSEVERVWAVSFAPGKTEGLRFMRHMREPLRVMHQPLLFVAYSHCAEWLAGIILRCWGFVHLSCEDTGVTYWLRRGAAAAAARRTRVDPGFPASNDESVDECDTVARRVGSSRPRAPHLYRPRTRPTRRRWRMISVRGVAIAARARRAADSSPFARHASSTQRRPRSRG